MDLEIRRSADILSLDGSQFQTIDEVQNMIRKLRLVEQDMKKRRGSPEECSNGSTKYSEESLGINEDSASTFDELSTIDLDTIPNLPDDIWLFECASAENGENIILNIFDDSYLDTGLRNVRYVLLNSVKAAINEDRTATTTSAAAAASTRLKRNVSYVIRRDGELSTPPSSPYYASPNVLTTSPYTYNGNITEIYFPAHGSVPNSPHQGTDMNNTTVIMTHHISPRNCIGLANRPENLNATITKNYSPKVMGYNPHNLNSSGPNSPELNTTFCQGQQNQEEALSTSSNSNNSVYNISMEEVNTMARMQEQSLAVTSTPYPLCRKETHTLDFTANGETLTSPNRTWSTDTYCLDQSNPPSDPSSGVSSPRDSQSYENVQIAGDAVRRSMPNLAIVKEINSTRKQSSVPQVPPSMSQLRRAPHYISDSKLARPQSRMLSRPSVPAPTFSTATYQRPSTKLQTNNTNTQAERPYTAQYQTLTRGKTFQKSGSPVLNSGQDGRPHTAIGKSQGQVMMSGRGVFQSRDGGGRSVPRYAANFQKDKEQGPSEFQPHPGLNTTMVLDCDPTPNGKMHPPPSAGGTQNFVSGISRPSQLPSRLGSRIPAPGSNRTQWPNRTGQ